MLFPSPDLPSLHITKIRLWQRFQTSQGSIPPGANSQPWNSSRGGLSTCLLQALRIQVGNTSYHRLQCSVPNSLSIEHDLDGCSGCGGSDRFNCMCDFVDFDFDPSSASTDPASMLTQRASELWETPSFDHGDPFTQLSALRANNDSKNDNVNQNEVPRSQSGYSSEVLWTCCSCGNGPSLMVHSIRCCECEHGICDHCSVDYGVGYV